MKKIFLIVFSLLCSLLHIRGEDTLIAPAPVEITLQSDTSYAGLSERDMARLSWRPDPIRAMWMGLIIPGYGQIYNQSYWKLPIVYGGIMGCVYATILNNSAYKEYKEAYRDLYTDIANGMVSNDASKSYITILPSGYTIERMGGATTYQTRLKSWQDRNRRYRDLAIAGSVLVYALSVIDAYVDAQLFDFDISQNLSMKICPNSHYDEFLKRSSHGIMLAFRFQK